MHNMTYTISTSDTLFGIYIEHTVQYTTRRKFLLLVCTVDSLITDLGLTVDRVGDESFMLS